MIAQKQYADVTVHDWRAHLMRLCSESGMSLKDPLDAAKNEARRVLIESRLNYARKLKEKFLGGPARFLLGDQPAAGIDKLERRLHDIIDDSLRFSCRIWSRPTPLRIHDMADLGGKPFSSTNPLMRLCHVQAPRAEEKTSRDENGQSPPGYHDGRPVIMVLQPAIESIADSSKDNKTTPGLDEIAKLWTRARVLVSSPARAAALKSLRNSGSNQQQATTRRNSPPNANANAAVAGLQPGQGQALGITGVTGETPTTSPAGGTLPAATFNAMPQNATQNMGVKPIRRKIERSATQSSSSSVESSNGGDLDTFMTPVTSTKGFSPQIPQSPFVRQSVSPSKMFKLGREENAPAVPDIKTVMAAAAGGNYGAVGAGKENTAR